MIKRPIIYGACLSVLFGGLISCNNGATTDNKNEEEIHNPATQTIPDEAKELIGRWDITVEKEGKQVPSWLEIKLSGFNTLVGYFVSDAGSADLCRILS